LRNKEEKEEEKAVEGRKIPHISIKICDFGLARKVPSSFSTGKYNGK
jgi:hypothetical protein